jgi:hypothetical protein
MSLSPDSIVEFVTITRGGGEGLIAVLDVNGEHKYFELVGLKSLLKTCSANQQLAIQYAVTTMHSIDSVDDIPEFEGGLPVQGSLF